jgi:hypothetical protein
VPEYVKEAAVAAVRLYMKPGLLGLELGHKPGNALRRLIK